MDKQRERGRPPVPASDQLSEIVQFRLTPVERKQCEAAAERAETKFSAWIRQCVVRAAKRQSKRD